MELHARKIAVVLDLRGARYFFEDSGFYVLINRCSFFVSLTKRAHDNCFDFRLASRSDTKFPRGASRSDREFPGIVEHVSHELTDTLARGASHGK